MSVGRLTSMYIFCYILIITGAFLYGAGSEQMTQPGGEFGVNIIESPVYIASIEKSIISPATVSVSSNYNERMNSAQMPDVTNTSTASTESIDATISQQNITDMTIDGELDIRRPPANTIVNHKLTIDFETSVQNETIILFNQTYDPDAVQLNSVAVSKGTANITADVITVNNSDMTATSGQLTAIQLQLKSNQTAQTVTIDTDIHHPDILNVRQYQLRVTTTETLSSTSIARYQVRPIGSDRRSGLRTEFDRTDGTGFVYANATIYQGERDIQFRGELTEQLTSVGGDNEGVIIEPPIQSNTDTGIYSVDGTNTTASVRVSQPKITTLRLENYRGSDVTDGRINPEKTDTVTVIGQSNFQDAEELELTVTNDDGIDITNELINTDRVRPETTDGTPPSVQSRIYPRVQSTPQDRFTSPTTRLDALGQSVQSPPHRSCDPDLRYKYHDRYIYTNDMIESRNSTKRITDNVHRSNKHTYQQFSYDFIQSSTSCRGYISPMRKAQSSSLRTQVQNKQSPERSINETDIQPGDTVTVTVNATVGSDNAFSIAETFTPNVRSASIVSTDTGGLSKSPFVAAATSAGIVVSFQDIPEGTPVGITYEVQTGLSPETYQITGSIDTTNRQINVGQTEFVVGTGGSRSSVTSGGKVRWQLDTDKFDTSTATIRLTGSDDLIDGTARSTTKLRITRDPVSLSLDSARLTRGEDATIEIENGVYGKTYTVGVQTSETKDNINKSDYYSIFRDVGTTQSIGVMTDDGDIFDNGERIDGEPTIIFARVQIDTDDGTGVTRVRSENLKQSATIELFNRGSESADSEISQSIVDRAELTIVDQRATLSGPGEYVIGSEATIRGRTGPGTDTVLMYVESDSAFELVDLDGQRDGNYSGISVSGGDFTYETRLSVGDASGNRLFSLPGEYRAAILPKSSVLNPSRDIQRQLSKSTMLSEATSLHTIRVRNQTVTVTAPGIQGTVADTEDTIRVSGTIEGPNNALVVAIGERGRVESKIVNGDTFENIALPSDSFSTGALTLYAITTGRDGIIGDGQIPAETSKSASARSQLQSLQSHIESVSEQKEYTGGQIRTVLRSETDLDTASDDPVVKQTARVVPATITIQKPAQRAAVPTGEPLTVAGTTTVSPTNAQIDVTISGGNRSLRSLRIQQWNNSWSVDVEMNNLTPGLYYIDVSVGDVSSERKILLNDRRSSTHTSAPATVTSAPNVGSVAGMGTITQTQTQTEDHNENHERMTRNGSSKPAQNTTQDFNMTHAVGVGIAVAFLMLSLLRRV